MAYLEVRELQKTYVTPRGATHVLGGVNLGSVSVEADGTVSVGLPVYRI